MGNDIIAHLIFFSPTHILHVNIPTTTHFEIHTSTQLVQQYILVWPAKRYILVSINTSVSFQIYRYFIYLIYIYIYIYICVCVCVRARTQYFLNTFTTNHIWLFFIGSNLNLPLK